MNPGGKLNALFLQEASADQLITAGAARLAD